MEFNTETHDAAKFTLDPLMIGHREIDYAQLPIITGATMLKSPNQVITGINSLVTVIVCSSSNYSERDWAIKFKFNNHKNDWCCFWSVSGHDW